MRISDWSSDVCSSDLVIIAAANLSAWKGRTPVLVDDVISSGHTLANAAREIREQGFPAPICLAVHGLFASDAEAMLRDLGCRSEEHTSELQSLMRISYAVFCLKKKTKHHYII